MGSTRLWPWLTASLFACAAHAAERIPVGEFAPASGSYTAMDLSPDGSLVVGTSLVDGEPIITVMDVAKMESSAVMRGWVSGYTVNWCGFKTNRRLLCGFQGIDHVAGIPYPVTRLVGANTDRSGTKVLSQRGTRSGAQLQDRIVHWLPDDPSHVLIEVDDGEDSAIFPGVYRLDVETGDMRRVLRPRDPVLHWYADRKGVVRFGYGYSGKNAIFVARNSEDDTWRVLSRFERFGEAPFQLHGFGILPGTMLVSLEHNGRDAIYEMDLTEKNDLQLLYAHPTADVDGVLFGRRDGGIVGFTYETDRPQRQLIDPDARRAQAAIDASLPGTSNVVLRQSAGGSRFLVSASSDVHPPEYFLFDLDARTRVRLASHNQKLAARSLAPQRSIEVKTPEGLVLPGYLTLPVGVEPKNLPAIVLPHGGPYSRDSWGYDPLVQLLASRGYAVIQVNFRGSTGYGKAWKEAGFQGWGTVMHEDITSAARWLIAQGVADPKRLCIVGWSYGGYAALIGAIKEPGLYRCAASIAGVTSLGQLQRDREIYYGGSDATRNQTGTEDLAESSPVRLVDRMQVPVLLVHGTDDMQVRVDHSKRMAKALEQARKPAELVLIEDGDHSLSRAAWRETLYARLTRFLEANLGP
jgi:dipeptidyl aminopeptidase/acylaminoacyl peptidase